MGEGVASWLVRVFSGAMALLLAGCVSTRPLAETRPPPAESGVVVLKVVSDGYHGTRDLARFVVSARLRRDAAWTTSGASRVRLPRGAAATNSSVMLGGVVEPGQYSLVSLELKQQNYSFEDDALRFEVKPGAVTLLGTLIFHGRGVSLKHLPADARSFESIEQSFPTLLGNQSAKREVVLPVSSSLPDARLWAQELKKDVRLAGDWTQLENGDFAAPGRLGTIVYRKHDSSRRQIIDVGDWREVLSVSSLQGGIVVAGEEGLLRFSADGGGTWRSLPPPARGMIRAVRPTGQAGAIAIVRTGAQWALYATPDVFSGGWHRVSEFAFEDLADPDEQPLPLAVPLPKGFGLMQLSGAFRFADVNGQVRSSSTAPVASMEATRDGLLLLKKRRVVGTSVSSDDGASWSDLSLPYSTLAVAIQDRRTFYAIAAIPGEALHPQFATYVTRDGGANWSRSGRSPVEPGQASRFWAAPEGTLQIELADGAGLRSSDAGLTWNRLPD